MDEKPFDTINVIPFVDIMLVLLTIVLTTSSFIASGRIPIHLPHAAQSAEQPQQTKTIELDAHGAIYFDGKPLSAEALKAELTPLARDTPFIIRADKDVSLQGFINVADILKQLNFVKVAVQTAAH
ncbi:ExbD/TolR family protein [Uliginosibacterium gangwonense]|uniref:ExbD/TolR family protein n=1 Tax=Uliginosibacterium gangwonense TaxID=392736 RepID=UPI000369CF3F|nr:biopolymer transporter ExbD [Uliginosibacterium gangwonense]